MVKRAFVWVLYLLDGWPGKTLSLMGRVPTLRWVLSGLDDDLESGPTYQGSITREEMFDYVLGEGVFA